MRPLYGVYDRLGRIPLALRRGRPWTTPDRNAEPPVFIIGSGRSGNTLLRAMLVSGGDLAIPPESYVLPRAYRDHSRFGWMAWDDYATILLGRMLRHPGMAEWNLDLDRLVKRARDIPEGQRSLARLIEVLYAEWAKQHAPDATRWGDKTPLNTLWLPRIERMFPDARYVHILRDGRDVALSYVKAGLYPDVGPAARRWRQSVRAAERHGRLVGPERYREVRYEDLVHEPEVTLQTLCSFLGLDHSDQMLGFWRHSHRLGDTRLAHHANLSQPLHTDSVGRWKRDLDPAAARRVASVAGDELARLGYGGNGGNGR